MKPQTLFADSRVLNLLCLLVPELQAKVPAKTLTVKQLSNGMGIGSIFVSPPTSHRYETGWRQHWHRQVTLADIQWLVSAGYLWHVNNDTYRLNAEEILKACEAL